MFAFLAWCLLFVMCWPLALLALVAYPFVWLILLPFRLLLFCFLRPKIDNRLKQRLVRLRLWETANNRFTLRRA